MLTMVLVIMMATDDDGSVSDNDGDDNGGWYGDDYDDTIQISNDYAPLLPLGLSVCSRCGPAVRH